MKPSRRKFFGQAAGLILAPDCLGRLSALAAEGLPNPVGYATITWLQAEFQQALETISSLGFHGVQMLGWVRDVYAGPKAAQLKEHLGALQLEPVTLSCSNIRLDPARPKDETAPFAAYADFFRSLGGQYLQVTDGGRPDRTYSSEEIQSLGSRMNDLGSVARKFGLTVGYHPHFGTLGETREGLGRVLEATDPQRVKLIADVAHLTLGGADPAEVIRTYRERLILTHFKDVPKDVVELARRDRDRVRHRNHTFCEIGAGVVDFPAVLRAFREARFEGWVVVELDDSDPATGGPAESARRNKAAVQQLGLNV